jgi:lantibiotic leader peptide-processing serine protease
VFKSEAVPADASALISAAGGELLNSFAEIGVVVARSDQTNFRTRLMKDKRIDGAAATTNFGTTLNIESVEVVDDAAADLASWGDDRSSNQWDMLMIHVPEAHAITTGNKSVIVGDLDTGADYTHSDLAPNIDFGLSVSCVGGVTNQDPLAWKDDNGHGTHTAGTIAAAKNGTGIVGVAPDVTLAIVKTGDSHGFFYPEAVVCSFVWAADHGFAVTNNSYFADPWWMNCHNDPVQQAIWKAETRAIRYAMSKGVSVVAAAGNDATDLTHPTTDTQSPDDATPVTRQVTNACNVVPAEVAGVITVSAITSSGAKASYSNYGMGLIQVAAPGSSVYSTFPGNRYARMSGTSMASPHVAGVAALLVSQYGKMAPGKLQAYITSTAIPQACPTTSTTTCVGDADGYTSYFGHGRADAFNAVTHVTD